jgi:hypothetical protein
VEDIKIGLAWYADVSDGTESVSSSNKETCFIFYHFLFF